MMRTRLLSQTNLPRLLALLALSWLVLSHAWMTDDAYFSFRSVDNFVNGYGLTWNITERVQGFTHPLWVLLLSLFYFFTHEIYLTSIAVSLVLTLGLAWLVMTRFSASRWHGLAAVGLLCLSTAFIDYSTSGLENPLSHVLMAGFLAVYLGKPGQRRLFWLTALAGLATLNRMDTVLLYAPALAFEWWQRKDKLHALGEMALALSPLLIWEVFSLIYYGFPFPNTFYAKELNYVALGEEVWAGLNYLFFTLKFDPLTWAVILAAWVTALVRKERQALLIGAGTLLYALYILQIGGDFMGGRFLSTAYLAAVILLLKFLFPTLTAGWVWAGLTAAVGVSLMASSPPYFLYAKGYHTARWNGVVDERMVYSDTNLLRINDLYTFNSDPQYTLVNKAAYLARGLWRGTLLRLEPEHDWIRLGRQLRAQAAEQGSMLFLPQGANGFTGYYAGPQVYFIHGLALTDGLLARVPPRYNPNWRSGHFMRLIPEGYLEVEAGSAQHLPDGQLDAYYQAIRLATHGPLFSAERWQAIWALNTRDFEDWLPGYAVRFRFPNLKRVQLDLAPTIEAVVDIRFSGQGSAAQVEFPQLIRVNGMRLAASAGDNFDLVFLGADGAILGQVRLRSRQASGIETYSVEVPGGAVEGFNAIRVEPLRVYNTPADGQYLLHSLLIPVN